MAEKKGPAKAKWLKIDKAQQATMLEVLGAAILVGVAVVLSIWLVKYIVFNSRVIGEKDVAIKNYETSLKNLSTLEANVMAMSDNADLESVARDSLSGCYGDDGKKIDFYKEYNEATDEKDKEQYLNMMQVCSALRVIPDALPSQENAEAALSSLNQLFLWANATPSSLAPNNDNVTTTDTEKETTGLQTLPLRMAIEADDNAVFRSLSTIERSIREFDVTRLTFEWNSSGVLTVQGQLKSYYSGDLQARETTKTIKATEDKKKK